MATGRLSINANIAGVSINGTIEKTGSGQISEEVLLTAGKAATLSTRTSNTVGELTLATGHGIVTSDVVDLYWTNTDGTPGKRVGVVVGTVEAAPADVAVPITDSGTGDNLPAEDFDMVVGIRTEINADFEGDEMLMLAVAPGNQRTIVDFIDSGDSSLLTLDVPANGNYAWSKDNGVTNPLAGDTVDAIVASCGSTTADTIRIGVLKEST